MEVQQLDRFIDEQGNELKENSHPFVEPYEHADLVRILKPPLVTRSLVGGGRVLIKNAVSDNPRRNKRIWLASGAAVRIGVPGGSDDPRCNGASPGTVRTTIRFSSDGSEGSTADTGDIGLPCENWWLVSANSGAAAYEYRDTRLEDGPCTRVSVRSGGSIKAICARKNTTSAFPYDLTQGTDEGLVNVELRTGLLSDCSTFDARAGKSGKDGRKFKGTAIPAGSITGCASMAGVPRGEGRQPGQLSR